MSAKSLTDKDRRDFLNILDRAHVDVTEWEARFIEDTYEQTEFTFKQRLSIDRMIERYGETIGF